MLTRALPLLEEAIGLPYPRVGPLVVSEAAGGEASTGALPSVNAEIQVAFDAADFTLVHQAAHVWIGDQLAVDRWAREGLASHYAARVAPELGVEPPYDPAERVADLAADAMPLVEWFGDAGPAADAYGYAASWTLVDRISAAVGEPGLATALSRIVAGLSAYDPAKPDAEATDGRPYPPADTRRLLDQLAAVSTVDVTDLFREAAFGPDAGAELSQRDAARAAYRSLLAAAGEWGAPDPVRAAMGEWRFKDAEAGMALASELADRTRCADCQGRGRRPGCAGSAAGSLRRAPAAGRMRWPSSRRKARWWMPTPRFGSGRWRGRRRSTPSASCWPKIRSGCWPRRRRASGRVTCVPPRARSTASSSSSTEPPPMGPFAWPPPSYWWRW